MICVTDKDLKEFEGFYGDICVHLERQVCNSCVYQHTKCAVQNSIIYFDQIKCPEPDCHGIFDYQGIREIIRIFGKDKILFDRYDEHIVFHQLEQMSDFIWCSFNCGSGQIIESDVSANPMFTCTKCNRSTCRKHRTIWHTDMTCDQYDLLQNQPTENDANQTWLRLFSKQCPKCFWNIQKNEGCDHMTCRHCKHEFCWECLMDYQQIANAGANHHQKSCSHYQVTLLIIIQHLISNSLFSFRRLVPLDLLNDKFNDH